MRRDPIPDRRAPTRPPRWAIISLLALGLAVATLAVLGAVATITNHNRTTDLQHRLSRVCGQLGTTTTTVVECRTVQSVVIQVPPVTVIVQSPPAPAPSSSTSRPRPSSTVKAAPPPSSTSAPPPPSTSPPASSTSTSTPATTTSTRSTLPPLISIPGLTRSSSRSPSSSSLDGFTLDGVALVAAVAMFGRAHRREIRRQSR